MDELTGEKSVFALVEKETGAKSPYPELTPVAMVVTKTYLHTDGSKMTIHEIGGKQYDDESIKELEQKFGGSLKDLYLPEDRILSKIKKLPDGTYDLSELEKSTRDMGWEYINYLFPKSKANDAILGNNHGKPEIFKGVVPNPMGHDYFVAHEILIYNDALAKKCKDGLGYYRSFDPLEVDNIGDFKWHEIAPMELDGYPLYDELDKNLNFQIMDLCINDKENAIGTPDKKTGVHIRRVA